jgi:hypothetical protein
MTGCRKSQREGSNELAVQGNELVVKGVVE